MRSFGKHPQPGGHLNWDTLRVTAVALPVNLLVLTGGRTIGAHAIPLGATMTWRTGHSTHSESSPPWTCCTTGSLKVPSTAAPVICNRIVSYYYVKQGYLHLLASTYMFMLRVTSLTNTIYRKHVYLVRVHTAQGDLEYSFNLDKRSASIG